MRRFSDVVSSVVIGVVLLPVALCAAVMIRFSLGSPVLFRQERVGRSGQRFVIVKFRTMLPDREDRAERERCTRTGEFLRATGIDEYPQLWNILRGEMSVIGPRPTLPEQVERYTAAQRRRHLIRPGLTGWAQVNGRNSITWPQRIELDIWYIDHRSLMIDLKILWLTALRVITPRDLYGEQGRNPDFPGGETSTPPVAPG